MNDGIFTAADIERHKSEITRLASKYHVTNVRLFGSVVQGNTSTTSDIDFLVEPEPECSGFDLGGLYEELERLLGRPIDVVTLQSLHWFIRDNVLAEAVSL